MACQSGVTSNLNTIKYPFNYAHYYLCICQPNTLHSPGDIKVQKLLLENAISNMGEYHIELLTDNKVVELEISNGISCHVSTWRHAYQMFKEPGVTINTGH